MKFIWFDDNCRMWHVSRMDKAIDSLLRQVERYTTETGSRMPAMVPAINGEFMKTKDVVNMVEDIKKFVEKFKLTDLK